MLRHRGLDPRRHALHPRHAGLHEVGDEDTFDHLKDLGGKHVRYWYVVGPFTDHFQTPTAIWKSVKDVKSTFDSKLGKNANARFILDASEERQCHTWGMKVRAEHRTWEGMVVFSYAPAMGANAKTFTRFPSAAFRPF